MLHDVRNRTFAVVAMGILAVLLLAVFGASANPAASAVPSVLALLAALVGIWLVARARSARSAWARGCLVNGMLSAAVGVGLRVQVEPWSGREGYPDDLERAIGPLTNLLWAFAARAGLVAFVLAAVLLAISYWLFRPPRREA